MDEKRQPRLESALIAAAVLLPVIPLSAYAAGYFWLGAETLWYARPNAVGVLEII